MNPYRIKILSTLLDRYENSILFKEKNKVNLKIAMSFNRKNIPEYFDENHFEKFQDIQNTCNELEASGMISIHWENKLRKNQIQKVILNPHRIFEIYAELQRTPRSSYEVEAMSCLQSYLGVSNWMDKFILEISSEIKEHNSNLKYLNIRDPEELNDILKGLAALVSQQSEIPKRQFSIQIYSDSKRFEILERKILKIVSDYFPEGEGLTYEELLGSLNVLKNPGFVYLKGRGTITQGDTLIDLFQLGGEVALSSTIIDSLKFDLDAVDSVITVENLTSFMNYRSDHQLVIYLGGFMNRIRKQFLMNIFEIYPRLEYFHFGDMDLGGFSILNHMNKVTGIPFKPYKMDRDTFLEFKNYLKPAGESYLKSVKKAIENDEYTEYRDTLQMIIELKGTLEQEIIGG